MEIIEKDIQKLLSTNSYNMNGVRLLAQGKVSVEVSYKNFVQEISKETTLNAGDSLKMADAFTTQIAVFGYSRKTLDKLTVIIDNAEKKVTY